MGNYRYISPDIKMQIYDLSTQFKATKVAYLLDVSPQTVRRLKRRVDEAGGYADAAGLNAKRTGGPRKLDVFDLAFLEGCVERKPDYFSSELQQELNDNCGIFVCEQTIENALYRRGFTRKQITRPALERNEEQRIAYMARIGEIYTPQQLVFVDEAGMNRNTTKRKMGWAPVGWRARRRDYFVRGKKYSMLPAISLDGVLHLDVIEGSYNGDLFESFIDGLLDSMEPWPASNSVVVMDNASIHKGENLRPLIEGRGMRLEYLPPYSPDFDPIEEGFSLTKTWIRLNRDYVRMELEPHEDADPYTMLWKAVFESMTPENIQGWYKDAGYL